MNQKSDGSLTQAVNEYRLAVGMIADELAATPKDGAK